MLPPVLRRISGHLFTQQFALLKGKFSFGKNALFLEFAQFFDLLEQIYGG